MRITTINELAAYLRTEIVRIHAAQATLGQDAGGDGSSRSRTVHLDGQLAAVQRTLAMVSDDAFADVERQAVASDDRLRPGAAAIDVEETECSGAAPVGVAVTPDWPGK